MTTRLTAPPATFTRMPTTSSQPTELLFLDLEATGDDERTSPIIEAAGIIVAWEPGLPEISRGSMVIRPPGSSADHDRLWAGMLPVIRDMHHASGLWTEATVGTDAWDPQQADTALARWISEHTTGPVPLAGSGVGHYDHRFVRQQLPRVAGLLTYWPVDFGSVRRALQLAGRDDLVNLPRDVYGKPHRAMADVELHLAEAREHLALLGSIPRLEHAG